MPDNSQSIKDDIESFYNEAHDDYVGLWQIFRRTHNRLIESDVADTQTLEIVRALIARGLLAGNLTKDGGFEPWEEEQPDAVVNRVQREWRQLGRAPTIDDIAWFHLPR
jgi:hypothetical protein